MSGKREGFTLIELLVVIAIILVLAAILFPVYTAAMNAAKRSACASNMQQLFSAVSQYCGDNSGKVPPSWGPPTGTNMMGEIGGAGIGWPARVMRYAKNRDIFICPTITPGTKQYLRPFNADGSVDPANPPTSYGLNGRFMWGGAVAPDPYNKNGSGGVTPTLGLQTLDSPPVPSRCVLIIETTGKMLWTDDSSRPPIPLGADPNARSLYTLCLGPCSDAFFGAVGIRWFDLPYAPFGHTGGCNIVCADGHVKFVKGPTSLPADDKSGPVALNGMTWWK